MVHPVETVTFIPNGDTNPAQIRKISVILAGSPESTTKRQTPKPLSGKLIVMSQGMTYVELLKDIKPSVDVDKLKIKLKNILKEEIKKKVDVASDIKFHNQEALIHINDIDPTMDADEVLEEVVKFAG